MIVLHANFDFDRTLTDPDELLERYTTLTGWSEALLEAGARESWFFSAFTITPSSRETALSITSAGQGRLRLANWDRSISRTSTA